MRIVGGRFRGTELATVGAGDPAAHLRPTLDRVREAIFNVLEHGEFGSPPPPRGRRVLDLFAGTGALGLEALSRGADIAVLVDDGAAARALLRANVERLRAEGATRIWRRDATRLGPNRGAPFDLVFLDPPWGMGLGEAALESARAGGWLAPGALIVWEEGAEIRPPPWAEVLDRRAWGGARVAFLRVSPSPASPSR